MKKKRPFIVEDREYKVKGVSAPPDWWETLDKTAAEMGINRSGLVRMAVNDFLKEERADETGGPMEMAEPLAA